MILESDAQILIIGGAAGSGKSYLLQLLPLFIIDDPNTNCICFRRNVPMLRGQGGVYDTALSIYNQLPAKLKPRNRDKEMEFKFPSGAKVKFMGMEYEKDKINIQGLQFTLITVDEATQFTWPQIDYMMSRLRSNSKYPSRMVMSCNPDPDHKIKELIDWYLDEEGYSIPERDGVKRYFIRQDGEFIWANSEQELKDKYGESVRPISFSFIGATIYDNPPMLENNPDYLSWLEGLPELEKAQLLHGNWNARIAGANYFQRSFLKEVDNLPMDAVSVRAYDKAGTERSTGNKNPDFTACIKISKDTDGFYYISGDYCPENYDDGDYSTQTYGRFCKKAGERDLIIRKQAEYDGDDVTIIFSVDPGQAGISEFNTSSRQLISDGYIVDKDPTPGNKAKLTRFSPFAQLSQQGFVRIVKNSFDLKTYEALMKELEAFDGTRSTVSRKDDFVDAVASGINYLERSEVIRPIAMPKINAPTIKARF